MDGLDGAFDVLLIGLGISVFNSLQLASRYSGFVSGRGKIVVKLKAKEAKPLEDALIRLSQAHNLSLAGTFESKVETRNYWLLLRPRSDFSKEKTFMKEEANFYRAPVFAEA